MFEISTPNIHIMYWSPTICLELCSFYVFLHNPLNWPVKVGFIPWGDLCGGRAVWLSTRLPWADSRVSFYTGVFVASEWEFQPRPIFCLPPGRSSGQRPRLTWHPGSSRVSDMRWGSGRCCALSRGRARIKGRGWAEGLFLSSSDSSASPAVFPACTTNRLECWLLSSPLTVLDARQSLGYLLHHS